MNKKCSICNSYKLKIILDKKRTNIFSNSEDHKKNNIKYKCKLFQCRNCNFVFQLPTKSLKEKLNSIYKSKNAQISQPLGEGNWGKERFNFLKNKLNEIYKYKNKKILELACGNAFLLKYFEKKSFKYLSGIDPSLNNEQNKSKIILIKKFITKKLKLKKKFDLIFSIGLYEHAYSIDDLTKFSIEHLSTTGKILVIVPNFLSSLKMGNPDLFAHEHISYFTLKTITNHFKKYNLRIIKNFSDIHSIALLLEKNKELAKKTNFRYKSINYNYNNKLEKNLYKIKNVLSKKSFIIHGACNSLNNITSWINIKKNYILTDNDEKKIGKIYFNNKVKDIKKIILKNFDIIIIIPTYFASTIKTNFIKNGYKGNFFLLK